MTNDQATMTNKAPSGGANDQWVPAEVCNCRQCEAPLARENILVQLNRREIGPTRQRIRAWCEHCSAMFELSRELRGGVWQMVGEVETVTDVKRRAIFLVRLQAQTKGADAA